MLGVPTVSDRIAQTVVTMTLEPILEPVFHVDSYGYRRGKSPHDALAITRKRCWERDWVLEYDIRGLFDHIDHELLLKALDHHCSESWVLLYVRRWLTAPMQTKDGKQERRNVGTPQGGPLSPVLANLFLHYALDRWLTVRHPDIPFCRYADDGILRCRSEREAQYLHSQLDMREVELFYRHQNETALKEEIVGIKQKYQELLNNSGEQVLARLDKAGINFVVYHPGAGQFTIPLADLSRYLEKPTAYIAKNSGVGEKLYSNWFEHYQHPSCNGLDENGQLCGKPLVRIGSPIEFHEGESDRCEHHQLISYKLVSEKR